jgi:hypothetical protein
VAASAHRGRKVEYRGWIGLGGRLWALRQCPRGGERALLSRRLAITCTKKLDRSRGVEGAFPGWGLYLLQTSTLASRAQLPR